MQMKVKTIFSSLILVLLISSLFMCLFAGSVKGQSEIHVATEEALKNAISNASDDTQTVIIFDNNIAITVKSAIFIPADKDITLRSNGNSKFSLVGASGANVLTVENRATLRLDGIIVTHVSGYNAHGLTVNSGGTLILSSGEIIGNSGSYGGVHVNGGSFTMTGGEISNNIATGDYYWGGGGVYMTGGTFAMSGGKISGNTAIHYNYGGGGIYMTGGSFTMSGGEISGNSATANGGGVYIGGGNFDMSGGTISNNKATDGGGIYLADGYVRLSGNSKISGNTASNSGGGVWVTLANLGRLSVSNGVEFSNNRATAAYNRDSSHNSIYNTYIGNGVVWTSPFTQGYNNYDISYVQGTPTTISTDSSGDSGGSSGGSNTRFTVTVEDAYGNPTGAGSYFAGTSVTLNAATKEGYTFSHWRVKAGGVYLSNSPYVIFTMPENNVEVVAMWSGVQYNIIYELNGGETDWRRAAEYPTTYTSSGDGSSVAIPEPIRKDAFPLSYEYKFLDWTVIYPDGSREHFQTYLSIPAGTMGDITLEANWASKGLMQNITDWATGIGLIVLVIIVGLFLNAIIFGNGGSSGSSTQQRRPYDEDYELRRQKEYFERLKAEQIRQAQLQREEQQRRWQEEQRQREYEQYRQQEEQYYQRQLLEQDPYEILEINKGASEMEVKDAWRELSKKWHPDTCQMKDQRATDMAKENFDKVQKAYEKIKQYKGWK